MSPQRRGEDHHKAKLTPDLVRQMRRWHAEGLSGTQIGDKIDWLVGTNAIHCCLRRETWRHIE